MDCFSGIDGALMALSANADNRQRQLANLKPFVKGQPTINPSGRPAVALDFRQRCRDFMEHDAPDAPGGWTILGKMARDPKSIHQARATELIAAYAYGRPPQRTELTGAEGAPVQIRYIEIAPVLGPGTPEPRQESG